MCQIPLSQGKIAIVSPEDHLFLILNYEWSFANGYPQTHIRKNGQRTTIRMHEIVAKRMSLSGEKIDHKDGNPLNNQRENLRAATDNQNAMNKDVSSSNKIGLKGVRFHKDRYYAEIWIDGRSKHLGTFNSPEEAACAYDKAAKRHFGEYARTNYGNPPDLGATS